MFSDLRFALRQIAKAPGFTSIIVLILALSIGACTAIYSALDSIVLRPYDDPATERNVFLDSIKLPERTERGLSFPDFLDIQKQATSFELIAQHGGGLVLLTGIDEPLALRRTLATQQFFDIYGIKMALGRAFIAEEFVTGRDNVVILTHALWQRAFGGAPDIIGRTVLIDDLTHTVVGVSSERAARTGLYPQLWLPRADDLSRDPSAGDPRGLRSATPTSARLRPGVTIKQAQAELDSIAAALAKTYPETNNGYGLTVTTTAGGNVVSVIRTLFGAVLCLMLIACANIASLLLVKANARQREMAVRAALGASRGRLMRQLLTENCLVALVGGTAGTLLAQWALEFIRTSIPSGILSPGLNRLTHLGLDSGMLAFALGLSLATAVVFGLAPAWLSSSADLNEALKQGTRGSTEGRSRGRFRATLVVLEVAMAVTLLGVSGVMIRSFVRLLAYEPGFQTEGTAVVRLSLRGARYATFEQEAAFSRALLEKIRGAAGVDAVGTTSFFPLSGPYGTIAGFALDGQVALSAAERPLARIYYVDPDYFRTLEIPLKRGRFFSEHDSEKAPRVAIINQTLAQQHFPNQDPIGKRITVAYGAKGWREIVGVVADVGHVSLDEIQPPQLYEPRAQIVTNRRADLIVVARGPGNAAALLGIIKRHVQALDPNLAATDMYTVKNFLYNKLTLQRLTLRLITAFSAIGLLIAALGIYGVIAFSVSQRTVEIGIRMALGAQKTDVLRLILRQGTWMIGIGVTLGLIATFIAGRALESQLYNTSPHDPVALLGTTVFFAAIAALACWLPARRATKIDPIVALRAE